MITRRARRTLERPLPRIRILAREVLLRLLPALPRVSARVRVQRLAARSDGAPGSCVLALRCVSVADLLRERASAERLVDESCVLDEPALGMGRPGVLGGAVASRCSC